MRRAILAATLGGLLLTGTACESDAKTTTAPPAPSVVVPSLAPASLPPDYTANTRKVCGELQKVFDDDIEAFGKEIGKMIAYKESKATADAEKAEKAAGDRLKAVAENIRKATATAADPAIKAAGTTSAAKFTKASADSKLFDSIKTEQDFNRAISRQLGDWLSPVSGYCT